MKPIIGLLNGMPNYGYGTRYRPLNDINPPRPKGVGFLGELARPDGGISTELSVDVGSGEIPTIVPTLTPEELASVLSTPEGQQFNDNIYRKAASHAAIRRLYGKSPFAGINDKISQLNNGSLISNELAGQTANLPTNKQKSINDIIELLVNQKGGR